ncbi:hypothetical protein JQX08_14530 [Pseudomonas sp. UL073]|uniref:Uncharacterized protein n=1 Tax=Zestomonas insulae TaxID=2809017 RepID=A0ABS2IFR9_9GAMM|nr:hypothetical protein [Pseudomonas insulae]MBM7061924.1 hypothetical protein [Pseudomonas insulae]
MGRWIKPAILLVVALGAALHFYIAAFKSSSGLNTFSVALMFWAWVPYAVCLWLKAALKNPLMPLLAACLILLVDGFAYFQVFVAPTSSTAALALLFAPLVNLLLVIPLGVLLGWLLNRVLA